MATEIIATSAETIFIRTANGYVITKNNVGQAACNICGNDINCPGPEDIQLCPSQEILEGQQTYTKFEASFNEN